MNKIFSYKIALTICAVVLTVIGLRMHIDPAGVASNEFPNALGDAHNIYRIIASLLLAIAFICVFARKAEDFKTQQLMLMGCAHGFAVMFITLGLMTVTQVAHIPIGTTVFAVLTALCLYTRFKTKSD